MYNIYNISVYIVPITTVVSKFTIRSVTESCNSKFRFTNHKILLK